MTSEPQPITTDQATESRRAAFRGYAKYFETLTPQSVPGLRVLASPDMLFKDPFNRVEGVDKVERVFAHMFEVLDRPRFTIDRVAADGSVALMLWTFRFHAKRWRPDEEQVIVGASEIHADPRGRITAHIDHWDAAEQVYEKMPVLGGLLRFAKRKLAVPGM